MATRRAPLTEAEVSDSVVVVLGRRTDPVHEEVVRDEVCLIHPGRIDLLMIRAALNRLAPAGRVREHSKRVWVLARTAPPVSAPRPPASGAATTAASAAPPGRSSRQPALRPVGSKLRLPDAEQQKVIDAPLAARLLVQAGPGYGKTDVICARVAALLTGEAQPGELLLLSFTRTAVREMRNRIAELAGQGVDTRGVEIRTVDSWVAGLRSGFVTTAMAESFNASIESVVKLLAGPKSPALEEELGRYRHVFVDEAQDLVGVRARVIVKVLERLSRRDDAGWTVFADPAQALYDWAEEGEETAAASFFEVLRESKLKFLQHELKTLHRTSNLNLKRLLEASRRIVLDERHEDPAQALRGLLLGKASVFKSSALAERVRLLGSDAEGALFLFRTRVEALEASSYLNKDGVPHRLRFGGLPHTVAPWVALSLAAIAKRDFTRQDFERALPVFESSPSFAGWEPEAAWIALRRIGAEGASRVRCATVAANIAAGRRLEELSVREVGIGGPILSTIHGSKGREAAFVEAFLSELGFEDEDSESEGRVLYVAASRAKQELVFHRTGKWRWGYESGRAWSRLKGAVQVEFGQHGDVHVLQSISFPDEPPEVLQARLAQSIGQSVDCTTHALKCGDEWLWPIRHRDGNAIVGALSKRMMKALKDICRAPRSAAFLRQMDVTSAAVSADELSRAGVTLPEPWKTTGVWLAPVVAGLCRVAVNGRKA